jgi:hypothetical protein
MLSIWNYYSRTQPNGALARGAKGSSMDRNVELFLGLSKYRKNTWRNEIECPLSTW